MRIHIGRISPALAESINELEQRLDRYGPRTSPLTLHKKEFGDFYFGFVDMDLDQKTYGSLRAGLNGVIFRQSKLEIKEARKEKPSYLSFKDQNHTSSSSGSEQNLKPNPEQLKRLRAAPPRQIDIYPGRMRTAKGIRQEPTFRVRIKGDLRKPKMRKRKLWGIEKRPLSKLTHHFVDGEWRDAEDHAVEVVAALHDEHGQAQRIAEDLALKSAYLSDSDFEDFKETARDIGQVDSDDDGIEVVPKHLKSMPLTRRMSMDEDESDEDDNDSKYMQVDNEPNNVEAAQNTTEALRAALGADAPFTLFGGAMESEQPDTDAVVAPLASATPQPSIVPTKEEPKIGLFFVHARSPYLRSQSQASKLVDSFDAKAWEAEFYENRGEWNRSMRKRRRDATRMAKRMGKKRGEQ